MMNVYTQHILQTVVAQICDTVGWHSIQSTPLELLMDLLHRHLTMTATSMKEYAELFGRTEPNLNDLALVFKDKKISIGDLEEYVQYVEPVPFIKPVPQYPIPRESHLNFLKPGSREVLTRPVHIHEYLPPMYPEQEEEEETTAASNADTDKNVAMTENPNGNQQQDGVFKRPNEPPTETPMKRPRIKEEECSARPTREISSVMMTTSGFISPAREGKLPEARPPILIPESNNSSAATADCAAPEQVLVKDEHKKVKKLKGQHSFKAKDKTKKKTKDAMLNAIAIAESANIKPIDMSPSTSEKRKKVVSMKEVLKNKALKTGVVKTDNVPVQEQYIDVEEDDEKPIDFTMENLQKILPKAMNQTQTYSPPVTTSFMHNSQVTIEPVNSVEDKVEKLPTATTSGNDKQKLSVFKKQKKSIKEEKSHDYVINHDIKKFEASSKVMDVVEQPILSSTFQDSRNYMEVDQKPVFVKSEIPFEESPRPGTSSSSHAELNNFSASSPLIKLEKEKDKKKAKKDKVKTKKLKKMIKTENNPIEDESEDSDYADEVQESSSSFCPPGLNPYLGVPYSPFANSPSLIPNPSLFTQLLTSSPVNKVFPRFPFPVHSGFPAFGQPPHMSSITPMPPMGMFLNQGQNEPEVEEKESEQPIKEEAPVIVPVCNVPPLVLPTDEEFLTSSQSNVIEAVKEEVPVEEKKKDKEHKKEKKDKEERSKKKKDKKDKVKNKDKEKKREKDKEKSEKKKEKKEKKREERDTADGGIPKLTLKFGPMDPSSPRPQTPDSTGSRKITIKPLAPRAEVEKAATPERPVREPSPELAKISALYTRPPKPKIPKLNNSVDTSVQDPNQPVASTSSASRESRSSRKSAIVEIPPLPPPPATKSVDQNGDEVWICPACGRQDDGSPMIGCDDCDAWYHWVCVGIQIPPDTNEDWYCSHCIQRKQQQAMLDNDKKRKRKKSKKGH
ncbi:transcription initiation factor TFIID subunit 3-like isoform X3 [Ctenocephalides felis]|uniref:transcription initiation factor TFIID subunit 3-like isoform X3 n=1 Tax=Ctenocephalides felis TaxID=7515 RepID=UPI000E6E4964|nr:transcription initiation factor TFIID subunit 3-like isoform X3 [Ctenocephalides felis]XP_026474150.1 transcription initiation factor TFIID subunit 3-like isoform X3 [Ctenocephalides felis]